MPPPLLYDISGIDLEQVLFDQEGVREANPSAADGAAQWHRLGRTQEEGKIIGFKDVRHDEFWVPFHVPGRPLSPGS